MHLLYHGPKLCLSWQNILSRQNIHHDKYFFCRDKHTFCRDIHTFVATRHGFCRDKSMLVATNTCLLSIKTFVATKLVFVAASAIDTPSHFQEYVSTRLPCHPRALKNHRHTQTTALKSNNISNPSIPIYARLASRRTSDWLRFRLTSSSLKDVVCGHCLKLLTPLPVSVQNHFGGDSVALGIVSPSPSEPLRRRMSRFCLAVRR